MAHALAMLQGIGHHDQVRYSLRVLPIVRLGGQGYGGQGLAHLGGQFPIVAEQVFRRGGVRIGRDIGVRFRGGGGAGDGGRRRGGRRREVVGGGGFLGGVDVGR